MLGISDASRGDEVVILVRDVEVPPPARAATTEGLFSREAIVKKAASTAPAPRPSQGISTALTIRHDSALCSAFTRGRARLAATPPCALLQAAARAGARDAHAPHARRRIFLSSSVKASVARRGLRVTRSG